jgi:hypothetical protein
MPEGELGMETTLNNVQGSECKKCGAPTVKIDAKTSQCTNSDCNYTQ